MLLNVRFELLIMTMFVIWLFTALMKGTVFWDMMTWWLVIFYHCFGGPCSLHLKDGQRIISLWENLLPHIGKWWVGWQYRSINRRDSVVLCAELCEGPSRGKERMMKQWEEGAIMTDKTDWEGEPSGEHKAEGEPGSAGSATIVYSCGEVVSFSSGSEWETCLMVSNLQRL